VSVLVRQCGVVGRDQPEGAAPVFRTTIRYHESAAVDMRRHGLLPYGLEQRHAAEKSARLARLHDGIRSGNADGLLSRDAAGLAADYAALAEEVLSAVVDMGSAAPAITRRPYLETGRGNGTGHRPDVRGPGGMASGPRPWGERLMTGRTQPP
jgi:hypothetical protein